MDQAAREISSIPSKDVFVVRSVMRFRAFAAMFISKVWLSGSCAFKAPQRYLNFCPRASQKRRLCGQH